MVSYVKTKKGLMMNLLKENTICPTTIIKLTFNLLINSTKKAPSKNLKNKCETILKNHAETVK